jgi:DNA-binding IclR family transcriptional regulator
MSQSIDIAVDDDEADQASSPRTSAGALTLFKGLEVLSRVAKGDATLGQMAKALQLNKTTVHRLASTLVEAGFLSFNARDTVNLGVLERDQVHYIDKIPGSRRIEVRCVVGERQPLRHTGLGKALLLDESEEVWREVFLREAAIFPRYRYDLRQWLEVMRAYRAKGAALDLDENEDHIRCVAAPIRDMSGKIVAAVSVSSIAQYMDDARIETVTGYVKEATAKISAEFGYR